MRIITLLALCLCCAPAAAQTTREKVADLENRMTVVEKRVTRLEKGSAPAAAAQAPARAPGEEVTVAFLTKKQVVTKDKVGVKLAVEFTNDSNRKIFAFNCTLVFRNEAGEVIWRKAYGYSEPLAPGEAVQVTFGLSSENTREYLRCVKARKISVKAEKMEVYGND